MRKKIPILLIILILMQALPSFSQDAGKNDGLELYSRALELLLEGDERAAGPLFSEFIETYPDSPFRAKAEMYLERYINQKDRSGIASFYLGNLGTAVYSTFQAYSLLDIPDNGVAMGTTGILALGAGLGSAWLMSRDIDMSLGKDLWIELASVVSLVNFNLAYKLVRPTYGEYELWSNIYSAGMPAALIAGRTAAYLAVRNRQPPAGQAGFATTTYAWSHVYLWGLLNGVFQSENEDLNTALAIAIPDLLSLGSCFLWDNLNWSIQRTGLVSVGGLGGGLIAVFAIMIAAEITPDISEKLIAGLIIGSSMAGQAVAVKLTSRFDQGRPQTAERLTFSLYPAIGPGGIGFAGRIGL